MPNRKNRLNPDQLSVESFPTLCDAQEANQPAAPGTVANFSTPNGCKLTHGGCSFLWCD
jgi:hypothetical protein